MRATESALIAVSGLFAAVLYQAVILGGYNVLSLVAGAAFGTLAMISIIKAEWPHAILSAIAFLLAPPLYSVFA